MSRHQPQANDTTSCEAHCFGPDGPGGALKSQVDKWRGGLSVGVWVASALLGLVAVGVGALIALAPGIVKSSVAEVTPGVVREELRKAGIAAIAEAKRQAVMADAPSTPWLIGHAHAETKGPTP